MKKILSLLIGLMVLATPVIAAEETEVLDPGITPDNPIYGLDRALERIQLAITFGEVEKAKLKFKFAEERLAEAEAMADEGEEELAEEMMEDYEVELNETNEDIETAIARGEDVTDLIEHVSTRTAKHLEVLQRVHDKVPEQARAAIEHAMEVSVRKQVGVLAHIEDGEELKERVKSEVRTRARGRLGSVLDEVEDEIEDEDEIECTLDEDCEEGYECVNSECEEIESEEDETEDESEEEEEEEEGRNQEQSGQE